jgi:hypothetical protein
LSLCAILHTRMVAYHDRCTPEASAMHAAPSAFSQAMVAATGRTSTFGVVL